jgi:hypothetical protein
VHVSAAALNFYLVQSASPYISRTVASHQTTTTTTPLVFLHIYYNLYDRSLPLIVDLNVVSIFGCEHLMIAVVGQAQSLGSEVNVTPPWGAFPAEQYLIVSGAYTHVLQSFF